MEIGTRVSGVCLDQPFVGTVISTAWEGGSYMLSAEGEFSLIKEGTLRSVTVQTDGWILTPAGRRVSVIIVEKKVSELVLL